MGQLNFFEDMGVRPYLRTLFKHIDIDGHDILFSVIDFEDRELTIAYICWSDPERYHGGLSDDAIREVEHDAFWKITAILEDIGFEGLKERCA